MNVIKGLIIKDFFNLKSYIKILICIDIIYLVSSFLNDDLVTFVPVVFPLCFGMIGMGSFSYDSIAKSDQYILTFPTTKKDMVKARYLYILFLTIIGTIFGFMLCAIIQGIKEQTLANIGDILSISIGAFCGMTMLQIFEIPIMYKFGAEKGRIIQMISIILLMLAISGITTFTMKTLSIPLESFLNMLQKYGLAIITIIMLLIYMISYKISLNIYNKKEI